LKNCTRSIAADSLPHTHTVVSWFIQKKHAIQQITKQKDKTHKKMRIKRKSEWEKFVSFPYFVFLFNFTIIVNQMFHRCRCKTERGSWGRCY
jgi:hypothetical protein